jgi:hypothetical protein
VIDGKKNLVELQHVPLLIKRHHRAANAYFAPLSRGSAGTSRGVAQPYTLSPW